MAAATSAAAKVGRHAVVAAPNLLPYFSRLFCWPPAADNHATTVMKGNHSRYHTVRPYVEDLVRHFAESFGLTQWATMQQHQQPNSPTQADANSDQEDGQADSNGGGPIPDQILDHALQCLREHPNGTRPFTLDFDAVFDGCGHGSGKQQDTGTASSSTNDQLVDIRGTPLKLEIGSGTGEWAIAQAAADHDRTNGEPTARWVTLELRHDRVCVNFDERILCERTV